LGRLFSKKEKEGGGRGRGLKKQEFRLISQKQ
jgi:hypothetical protein